ncbi:MAG: hypothetical protein M1830_008198 [Pleopsidium flavum]|nr:MAG: hypothetical protein M1830_008198 [Pleopsidium flavum]
MDEYKLRRLSNKKALNNGPSDGEDDQGAMIRTKMMKMDIDWGEDRATLGNSESDVGDDASTCYDSESDSSTDDGIDVGLDETRLLLWRHMTSFIAPNPVPREPNIRFAKVTLIRTNGEDNRPREKNFVVEREETPLLCPVDHSLSMALHDNVFAVKSTSNVGNIFRAKIPSGKKCLILKMKGRALDIPVFRESMRCHWIPHVADKPFAFKYMASLLETTGFKVGSGAFLHSVCCSMWLRQGRLKINNKAPSSVRDQIFDHQSNAAGTILIGRSDSTHKLLFSWGAHFTLKSPVTPD